MWICRVVDDTLSPNNELATWQACVFLDDLDQQILLSISEDRQRMFSYQHTSVAVRHFNTVLLHGIFCLFHTRITTHSRVSLTLAFKLPRECKYQG